MKGKSMTLPAFTEEERKQVHTLLAIRVAHMMGRKLEKATGQRFTVGQRAFHSKDGAI